MSFLANQKGWVVNLETNGDDFDRAGCAVIVKLNTFGEDGKNFRSIVSDRVLIVCRNLVRYLKFIFIFTGGSVVALSIVTGPHCVAACLVVFSLVQAKPGCR